MLHPVDEIDQMVGFANACEILNLEPTFLKDPAGV